jgi:hypothetical protein
MTHCEIIDTVQKMNYTILTCINNFYHYAGEIDPYTITLSYKYIDDSTKNKNVILSSLEDGTFKFTFNDKSIIINNIDDLYELIYSDLTKEFDGLNKNIIYDVICYLDEYLGCNKNPFGRNKIPHGRRGSGETKYTGNVLFH